MRPTPARLLLALAALPPAYADFVNLWQLVSFATFGVRVDEDIPGLALVSAAWLAVQAVAVSAALLLVWQFAAQGRLGRAWAAMAVAWVGVAILAIIQVRL